MYGGIHPNRQSGEFLCSQSYYTTMSVEYELEIKEYLDFPLDDEENTDYEPLGSSFERQISELTTVSGRYQSEYGGEHPWIHEWMGQITPKELPESWLRDKDDTLENRIEIIVESLMECFGTGCTPHNTSSDDFDITVQVSTKDETPLSDGVYTILVTWEPSG